MPRKTLAQRCLDLCFEEHAAGHKANPYGQPNTGPRVREYLAGCVRNGRPLGLTVGNWCAAMQSWVLFNALEADEKAPHLWRAGVVEIVADAEDAGLWYPVDAVRSGLWKPSPGDLAIWDRSNPEKPSTSWWRHVNRVVEYDTRDTLTTDDDVFATIGGNERRAIRLSKDRPKRLDSGKLLGFVSYQIEAEDEGAAHVFTDRERKDLEAEIVIGLDTIVADAMANLDRNV